MRSSLVSALGSGAARSRSSALGFRNCVSVFQILRFGVGQTGLHALSGEERHVPLTCGEELLDDRSAWMINAHVSAAAHHTAHADMSCLAPVSGSTPPARTHATQSDAAAQEA
eukprot:1907470-Rhodomonas_salina.1